MMNIILKLVKLNFFHYTFFYCYGHLIYYSIKLLLLAKNNLELKTSWFVNTECLEIRYLYFISKLR